ncbi:excisionase [Clostridium felsineum]|uniref:Uncharacterized protein n=1 Tax=Clostridium felsineum TaxID=36839 RepID=A0A1S8LDM4_9CLOT|nr:excisionase [Clostridium felsineum]URZ05872.1 hypothetical protein CLROS_012040 [Clostridium felsineum]URZ10909.1 hypothetical protein CROST_016250 [Clostridium felsineum]
MEVKKEEIKEIIKEAVKEAINLNNKLTLTVDETVKFSGIGRNKITELIYKEDTDFPYFRVGSKTLVNKVLLEGWLNKISEEKRVI